MRRFCARGSSLYPSLASNLLASLVDRPRGPIKLVGSGCGEIGDTVPRIAMQVQESGACFYCIEQWNEATIRRVVGFCVDQCAVGYIGPLVA